MENEALTYILFKRSAAACKGPVPDAKIRRETGSIPVLRRCTTKAKIAMGIAFRQIIGVQIVGFALLGCLAACNGGNKIKACDEFAAPGDRVPTSCPQKPPPKPEGPQRYCYSTLAQPDCFYEPQPGRSGYLGSQ